MKPRDRVLAALNHETTDRVPFQATFVPELYDRLRERLGIPDRTPYDPHGSRGSWYEVEKTLGEDALQCGIGWCTNYYLHDRPFTDDWGVEWKIDRYETKFGAGWYTSVAHGPLYDESAIAGYRPPDPDRPGLYTRLERLVREEGREYFIIGRLHTTIYETAWALRGMDTLLMDFALEPERANAVLDFPFRYHRRIAERMAATGVDMIWLGDDMGAQHSMLISPEMWRTFFKPRMADIIATVKGINPAVKVAYHTDGFVEPIIPDLVEIGLDVLNPVQAESMDPAALKKRFGDRLSFFGGIDVQSTLPFGTPDGVRKEFRARRESLGAGGGWICAPTHHVQLDTPLENLFALVEEVHRDA